MEKEMNWKEVDKYLDTIDLDPKHQEFKNYIKTPLDFYYSKPTKFRKVAADENKGETNWQRVLFEEDATYDSRPIWWDMELPIGQTQTKVDGRTQTQSKRVDMIGELKGRPVICELKFYRKGGSVADNPLEATIQLLAYYSMILNNADKLDSARVCHKNEEVKPFEWKELRNNPILMLRANDDYWEYWSEKKYDENMWNALQQIRNICKENGLEIQLWNKEGQIYLQ